MKKLTGILLIDDDDANNYLNQRLLRKMGLAARVRVFLNSQAAFNYLYTICQGNYDQNNGAYFQPDLILLDINMPGLDGFEFLDLYQNLPATFRENTLLVVLSTSAHPADREKAESYQVPFLTKPLTPEKLKTVLSQYFELPSAEEKTPENGMLSGENTYEAEA
jgi:CheY-like chemotaxis protein